ncbi:MAG TPA: toll/interleukin-1 receptor domain-containing protein [Fimbriimonadaceae bacterium]|nr:toll/interleukin-1 receptor domain-containing protein [Fimbriimonadaceae bacterium]
MEFDVFISHASEDKPQVVRPLTEALRASGVRVWLDEINIEWGESLNSAIDAGLARSRYGIVVLSPTFFAKSWPQRELDGLVQRQVGEGRIVILPIYHEVSNEDVRSFSPTLAAALALNWSDGIAAIVAKLLKLLEKNSTEEASQSLSRRGETQTVFSRTKSLLEEGRLVPLDDLLRQETDKALDIMESSEFDPELHAGNEEAYFNEFKRRVGAYEAAVDDLNAVQMAIAYYGGSGSYVALRRSLERLGDHPHGVGKNRNGGREVWTNLQRYPAVLSFHRVGAAAVVAERWDNLRPLCRDASVQIRPLESNRVPMIVQMKPHLPFSGGERSQWLIRDSFTGSTKRYTPEEDYLAGSVVESLARFGIGSEEADRVFDIWVFLEQIAYLGVPDGQGRWDPYFSAGRCWRILSVFHGWDNSPQGQLMARIQAEGDNSELLRSVIADGKASTFLERGGKAREMIETCIRRY